MKYLINITRSYRNLGFNLENIVLDKAFIRRYNQKKRIYLQKL